jgi:hypothetical protein
MRNSPRAWPLSTAQRASTTCADRRGLRVVSRGCDACREPALLQLRWPLRLVGTDVEEAAEPTFGWPLPSLVVCQAVVAHLCLRIAQGPRFSQRFA